MLVERQTVDAHLAMDAWITVHEMLVDAVVNDVPLVLARNLQDTVMGCTVNLVLGLLLDNQIVVLVDVDGAERRLCRAVADVVVGRACIIH